MRSARWNWNGLTAVFLTSESIVRQKAVIICKAGVLFWTRTVGLAWANLLPPIRGMAQFRLSDGQINLEA